MLLFYSNTASSHAVEVNVSGASVVESDKNISETVFTATLSQPSQEIVSVDYIISDGSANIGQDYSATNGTLIFHPGETRKTLEVTIIGDRQVEADETFRITLSNISDNAIIATDFATGTIIDDDIYETTSTDDNLAEHSDLPITPPPDPDTTASDSHLSLNESNAPPVVASIAPASTVYFTEKTETDPPQQETPQQTKGFFSSIFANIFRSRKKERVQQWHKFIADYKDKEISEQIKSTNDFFNKIRFTDDIKHWNIEDYWATPTEMLQTNGGDCEDFSIAKFFTLKKMGVDENRMRMIYVESTLAEQPHMVLAYYPDNSIDPLILDNLIDEIKHMSQRDDLYPVYSFNNHGIWIEKNKQFSIKISDTNYISHWKTVKEKIAKESLND